ncbi:MAG: hypothetical protein GXP45_03320 [bacterium]|nr:hypothetical protein [bacterium]
MISLLFIYFFIPMQKIDLHEDIISSFANDLSAFQTKVETFSGKDSNAGGLPNYKEADLQIVWAGVWPYKVVSDPQDPQKKWLQFSNKKLIDQWKKYETLRQENAIDLVLEGKKLANTKYLDYKLNFVYHIKGLDGLKGIEDIEKLRNV